MIEQMFDVSTITRPTDRSSSPHRARVTGSLRCRHDPAAERAEPPARPLRARRCALGDAGPAEHGLSPQVRHLPDAVRTAQAAADALGHLACRDREQLRLRRDDPRRRAPPPARHGVGGHWSTSSPSRSGQVSRASSGPTPPSCASTPASRSAASHRSATRTRCARSSTPTSRRTLSSGPPQATATASSRRRTTVRITGGQPMDVA